jgi:hypothetical protein
MDKPIKQRKRYAPMQRERRIAYLGDSFDVMDAVLRGDFDNRDSDRVKLTGGGFRIIRKQIGKE